MTVARSYLFALESRWGDATVSPTTTPPPFPSPLLSLPEGDPVSLPPAVPFFYSVLTKQAAGGPLRGEKERKREDEVERWREGVKEEGRKTTR